MERSPFCYLIKRDVGTSRPRSARTHEAPPVMALERPDTLDEIRDNVELCDRVSSVDVNTINFSTSSGEISQDQIPQLQALPDAMLKVVSENSVALGRQIRERSPIEIGHD